MKIFGIGLSRTGTTSLNEALSILGYNTLHYPYLLKIFDIAHYYDALTDTPVAFSFRELDRAYPGSKFIMTTRDWRTWSNSMAKKFESPYWADWENFMHRSLYGAESFDAEKYRESFVSHSQSVWQHFWNRREDLLILNVCAGEGWAELCPFLGKEIPDVPFPHVVH